MSRGTISQTPCGIKVTWKKPNNGGSPVTRFSIAIRGSNKKYSSLPNCGEQGEDGPTFCDASATVLEAAPYNLKPGQLIVVRTVAQNPSGYGRSSAPSLVATPLRTKDLTRCTLLNCLNGLMTLLSSVGPTSPSELEPSESVSTASTGIRAEIELL